MKNKKFLFLIFFSIAIFSLSVFLEDGQLHTSDANKRLAITHSIWTDVPETIISKEDGFETPRGLRYQHFANQVFLLLPFDIAGQFIAPYVESFFVKAENTEKYAKAELYNHYLRGVFVVFTFFPLLAVFNFLLLLGIFRNLKFSYQQSLIGCLLFAVGTTYFAYLRFNTINNMEVMTGLLPLFVLTKPNLNIFQKLLYGIPLSIFAVTLKFTNAGFLVAYYGTVLFLSQDKKYLLVLKYFLIASALSFLTLDSIHYYRYGLHFPGIAHIISLKMYGKPVEFGFLTMVENFFKYLYSPSRSVFVYEPFMLFACILFLRRKLQDFNTLTCFVFSSLYFFSVVATHTPAPNDWGNMIGVRYLVSHASLIGICAISYMLLNYTKRTIRLLTVILFCFFFIPSIFFNYHYHDYARKPGTTCYDKNIPCSIYYIADTGLYLADRVLNTNYHPRFVKLDEQSDEFRSVNKPMFGTWSIARYLLKSQIKETNYSILKNTSALLFIVFSLLTIFLARMFDGFENQKYNPKDLQETL